MGQMGGSYHDLGEFHILSTEGNYKVDCTPARLRFLAGSVRTFERSIV